MHVLGHVHELVRRGGDFAAHPLEPAAARLEIRHAIDVVIRHGHREKFRRRAGEGSKSGPVGVHRPEIRGIRGIGRVAAVEAEGRREDDPRSIRRSRGPPLVRVRGVRDVRAATGPRVDERDLVVDVHAAARVPTDDAVAEPVPIELVAGQVGQPKDVARREVELEHIVGGGDDRPSRRADGERWRRDDRGRGGRPGCRRWRARRWGVR